MGDQPVIDINLGERVLAEAAVKGHTFQCPQCSKYLILKRGQIKVPHFAHKIRGDCDYLCAEISSSVGLVLNPKIINSPITLYAENYGIIDEQGILYMNGGYFDPTVRRYTLQHYMKPIAFTLLKTKIISASLSSFYLGIVTEDGRPYIYSSTANKLRPISLPGGEKSKALKISMVNPRVYAIILENGTANFNMGYSIRGQKEPEYVNQIIKLPSHIIDVSIVPWAVFFVTEKGSLYRIGSAVAKRNAATPEEACEDCDSWDDSITKQNGRLIITPFQIMIPEPIKQISMLHDQRAALSKSGNVYVWGYNQFSQLGMDADYIEVKPRLLKLPSPIAQISVGGHSAAAVTENGKLYMWGMNNHSQIIDHKIALSMTHHPNRGRSSGGYNVITRPIEISIGRPVNYAAVNSDFTIAITNDGLVNYWGKGKS